MQKIVPFLWFQTEAEEAAKFYVSIFKNSKIDNVSYYGEAGPLPSGTAMVVEFQLEGQEFMALNGGDPAVTGGGQPPIALFVSCETQSEVDVLWDKLSAGGEKGQCGWLRDKYGFSWNIVPQGLVDLLGSDDEKKSQAAMRAMMKQQKLDIGEIRRAYDAA
jgi:predicted 3-demethylubiquinone-9 3-methyltransferase (glyoxalase superfamily)